MVARSTSWKPENKATRGRMAPSSAASQRRRSGGTFKEVFQEVHGQEAEPTSKPLDPELLIIAGEGKGHGRHLICNGAIATSSHHKLHEIRASSTGSTPSIRSRPTTASREIARLKVSILTLHLWPCLEIAPFQPI